MNNVQNTVEYKEILARKYYEYYHDEKYELYDIQEFYYPYFKIKCNCIFREKTKLSIVEEIFLSAIKEGINDLKELEVFLALDKEVFEELAAHLHIDKLFVETPILTLTDVGIKVLNDSGILTTQEDDRYVVLDAILGIPVSIDMTDERKKDKSKNKNNLRVQIAYPKTETLDKNVNNKALQTILFESIKSTNNKEKEIYEIKEILDTYKFHKKYYALFFKNENNPNKVLILNNGEPNDELTNIVSDFEQKGKNLFDLSKLAKEEHIELSKDKTIKEYSEVDNLDNGTQLSTYEHPKFFDYAFKYSKKEVVIVSPWIRWEVIEGKKGYIEDALKRNVRITFNYGMGKYKDLDKESKEFFDKMRSKYNNLLVYITRNVPDHSKILICDRDWMITTSFNWTSFKGDIKKGKRKEKGTFLNDRNEILKNIKEYSNDSI
ncbi:hypothetical protein [Aliarcobacter butzleri]|uniref:hypothetical protein n=1 Tax=Aliarcobacter butzleri TaxID=28197 RepID=UPI001EE043B2|nr:hypothetical protein [Aliarcobacter butzleri]MCG3696647.1 hypothetical protein [Aliarcobacter butzleri]MCG3699764.1 hypothetical protein [Aliarcobacter butzleri]MDN5078943.1 hypothetical protein [Aliarcobacter butzleri]MDN5090282.1 hypothetical protein [Aliarcobacter butzleri]